jgi:hypothetical protein
MCQIFGGCFVLIVCAVIAVCLFFLCPLLAAVFVITVVLLFFIGLLCGIIKCLFGF